MAKKRLVLALGHDALGTNLPEQKTAVTKTAKAIADFMNLRKITKVTLRLRCLSAPQ